MYFVSDRVVLSSIFSVKTSSDGELASMKFDRRFLKLSITAPYVPLDMNPVMPGNDEGVYKDAVFFSGHKFVGGVQSSGKGMCELES